MGANLVWARAVFDKKATELVQANSWVKLTIEIFTKVKGGIELDHAQALFNESKFDFAQNDVVLNRNKPFVIEKDIYLDENLLHPDGDLVMLKQI